MIGAVEVAAANSAFRHAQVLEQLVPLVVAAAREILELGYKPNS